MSTSTQSVIRLGEPILYILLCLACKEVGAVGKLCSEELFFFKFVKQFT